MGIRAKLLLPLLFLLVIIIGSVELYWLPNLAAREKAQRIEFQVSHLDMLEVALMDSLLNDNLSQVHLILSDVLEKHPEWKKLKLSTPQGRRLFPISESTAVINGAHVSRHTHEIRYLDTTLATLDLTTDLSDFVAEFESQLRVLDWLILVFLPMVAGMSALLQDRFVRRPLSELVGAAQGIAHGDFNVKLPTPSDDEVGQLIRSFARMCEMRNSAETALEELAYHDTLTNLPNRTMFKEHLTRALANAARTDRTLSLLFIDLDRFKLVNDTLGHEVGDKLLVEAAKRIEGCIRTGDLVARLGGDEFTVVLEEKHAHHGARVVSGRIIEALKKPFVFEGQKQIISASIGISLFPEHAQDYGVMMQCADTAMYRAKEHGGSSYKYYLHEMGDRLSHRMNIEAGLRAALATEQFVLHYQPKVELATGKIVGVEALVRWMDPVHGMVPPNDFIPLAEEIGLIIPIGEWVLRKACEQYAEWGVPDIELAVNLSANHLYHESLLDFLQNTLCETNFAAEQLEIEITENAIMQDAKKTTDILEQIKSLGIKIAIDDFGTGYSSLSYLKRFAIDTIKIDRSFVKDIPHDVDDVAITAATIAMAKTLNHGLVAEGIESQEQAEFLNHLGCELGQGYYFSKPVSSAEFVALLKNHRHLPVTMPHLIRSTVDMVCLKP